jgi:acetylornithine deacetylase/succinyl-diaminopimelate desuccinylase-like protein
MSLFSYISSRHQQSLDELTELLRIPSISTAPEHKADILRCAEWLHTHLQQIGLEHVQTITTNGHPAVYGEFCHAGANAPTVLFYGHYDVQPVDPLNLWTNPPFEPTVRDGKIYARGATDDKGQVFLQLKAIEAHLKTTNSLPVNVKVLIEGEEEIGSVHLEQLLTDHREKLQCDYVLISDTSMYAEGKPSLCYGLRGLTYMEVQVTGPNRDLHSGVFGGAVDNPLNVLCAMIARLKDEYGRMTIPGFYDDVLPLTEQERTEFARLPFDMKEYCDELHIGATRGEHGYTVLEQTWARPTLDVNGIWGGFTGEGAKTVLPAKAQAKISMRLVPNQDTHDIAQKFEAYFKAIAPPTVKVEVTHLHGGQPLLTPIESPAMKAAGHALKATYGVDPYLVRGGGSIPITVLFQQVLNAPCVLMGFGLDSENLHSPDEHFTLVNFYKGIEAGARFYTALADIHAQG